MTTDPQTELTETQKAYNVAQYEMFQLAAYGHCTYTNGEMLTDEGKRQQRDYNDRIRAAREELEAALLRLVAEHAKTFRGDWGVPAAWLRSLADDPAGLSLLAVRPDERETDAAAAVPVAAPPTTEQPGLRDRVRRALCEASGNGYLWGTDMLEPDEYGEAADAVLAELPAPADQAAALREAAGLAESLRQFEPATGARKSAQVSENVGILRVADELRRLADEAGQAGGPSRGATEPQPEAQAEAHPADHTWKVESPRRDTWASWGATYDERDWASERYESAISNAPGRPLRLVRATTTYTVEAEHAPAVSSRPGTEQEARS